MIFPNRLKVDRPATSSLGGNHRFACGRNNMRARDVPVSNAVFFIHSRGKVCIFSRLTVKSFRVQSYFAN